MIVSIRSATLAVVALGALVAGCSGGSGGGIFDRTNGNIVLSDGATGQVVTTSPESPYPVRALRFTINALEANFAGPYDVQIISQTNVPSQPNGGAVYGFTFSQPCFTVTQDATLTTQSVPLVFAGSNANSQPYNYPAQGVPTPGPSGAPPTTSGNPCHSGELESATISDSKGHRVNFYYEEVP